MEKKASSRHHFTASDYPPSYRQQEVEIIVQKIRARESLIVSSLGGSGKTHLVQFLVANQGFRQHYFRDDTNDFDFFLFDCNAVAPNNTASLLRIMIAELGEQAGLEVGDRLRSQTNEEFIIALKACLNDLYREGLKLVFVFDRFEKLLPSSTLSHTLDSLRFLRDHFARRISYLLVCRGEPAIPGVSNEFDDILAHPPILYLPPLSHADAELAVTLYEKERGQSFDVVSREWLIRLSGGFPRLLRAACDAWRLAQITPTAGEEPIIRRLLTSDRVREVCAALWNEIPSVGQRTLHYLVAGELTQDNPFLVRYNLVRIDDAGRPRVFCPLFAAFVSEWGTPTFTFDLYPPSGLRIDDTTITLTPHEYRFVEVLWRKPGEVVPYDALITAIYPEERERRGVTPAALAGLARRVRNKINVVPDHQFIENVRGIGYVLHVRRGKA